MQPIIWAAQFDDGSKIFEFDGDNNETIFTDERVLGRKDRITFFALIDRANNITYSIDMKTGEFILNKLAVEPGKQFNGRTYSFCNLPIEYGDGIIQFKCSKPLTVGNSGQQVVPSTFNAGYKAAIPKNTIVIPGSDYVMEVCNIECILSINADTLKPVFTTGCTIKYTYPDGKTKQIKA